MRASTREGTGVGDCCSTAWATGCSRCANGGKARRIRTVHAQFAHINATAEQLLTAGQPVISVVPRRRNWWGTSQMRSGILLSLLAARTNRLHFFGHKCAPPEKPCPPRWRVGNTDDQLMPSNRTTAGFRTALSARRENQTPYARLSPYRTRTALVGAIPQRRTPAVTKLLQAEYLRELSTVTPASLAAYSSVRGRPRQSPVSVDGRAGC